MIYNFALLLSTPLFVQLSRKNAPFCAVRSLYFVENFVSVVLFRLARNLLHPKRQKNQSK